LGVPSCEDDSHAPPAKFPADLIPIFKDSIFQ